jgi:hypothetical protein
VLSTSFFSPLELHVADRSVLHVAATLDVEERQQAIAQHLIVLVAADPVGLLGEAPLLRPQVLIVDVVGGPLLRIAEDAIRLDQHPELLDVSRAPVVGMHPLGQVAEHTLDRVGVGVGADLQHLVVVDEGLLGHASLPGTWADRTPRLAQVRSFPILLRPRGAPA